MRPGDAPAGEDPLERAAAWLAAAEGGRLPPAEAARLAAWLAADPRHQEAYDELCGLLAGIGPAASRHRAGRRQALAGLVALAAVGAGAWGLAGSGPEVHASGTAPGTVALADGSLVHLNAGTRLAADMGGARRAVELAGGQAAFEVAHDPARPVSVRAGAATVVALGTSFDVLRLDAATVVSVSEGRVRVEGPGRSAVALGAGQRVVASARGLGAPSAVDPASVASWRRGELDFDATPLWQVVAEFNRYGGVRLALADPALADLPVTGVFRVADAASFLAALPRVAPVAVEPVPGGAVIHARPAR